MGKILISNNNGRPTLMETKNIKSNVKFWTGDEQTYAYMELHNSLELLVEKVTSKEDGLRYFIEIGDTDPSLYKDGSVKEIDGVMYCEITDEVEFDETVCELAGEKEEGGLLVLAEEESDLIEKVSKGLNCSHNHNGFVPLGETITINGEEYVCTEGNYDGCGDCAFLKGEYGVCRSPRWLQCSQEKRPDKKDVYFIKK